MTCVVCGDQPRGFVFGKGYCSVACVAEGLEDRGVSVPERKPHGQGGTTSGYNECPGCGARIGELHDVGCDHEMCPECGEQLIGCDHAEKYLD